MVKLKYLKQNVDLCHDLKLINIYIEGKRNCKQLSTSNSIQSFCYSQVSLKFLIFTAYKDFYEFVNGTFLYQLLLYYFITEYRMLTTAFSQCGNNDRFQQGLPIFLTAYTIPMPCSPISLSNNLS